MKLLELFNLAIDAGESVSGDKTQYKITTIGDTVYLAIQWSVDRQDWLYNFMFVPAPYKAKKYPWYVHAGFAKAWKQARDKIASGVIPLLNGKRLVILGYSHGAALAILAHEYFQFNGYNPSTFAFGCPRVIWMPSKTIRSRFFDVEIINRIGDLVGHVPPRIFGYKHVAKVTNIGSYKSIWWTRHLIPEYVEAMQ